MTNPERNTISSYPPPPGEHPPLDDNAIAAIQRRIKLTGSLKLAGHNEETIKVLLEGPQSTEE